MSGTRVIECGYEDPLDLVWVRTAARMGMELQRSAEVYAAWDGAGCLRIADSASMDADDCLAQLVFHEMCHALVEGPDAWAMPDWGLSNRDERHLTREYACHRLQAALADRYGLRRFLAVTTDHRAHYDALPSDTLSTSGTQGPERDAAIEAAVIGWERAQGEPWVGPLSAALQATAEIAKAVQRVQGGDDEPTGSAAASLWARVRPLD